MSTQTQTWPVSVYEPAAQYFRGLPAEHRQALMTALRSLGQHEPPPASDARRDGSYLIWVPGPAGRNVFTADWVYSITYWADRTAGHEQIVVEQIGPDGGLTTLDELDGA